MGESVEDQSQQASAVSLWPPVSWIPPSPSLLLLISVLKATGVQVRGLLARPEPWYQFALLMMSLVGELCVQPERYPRSPGPTVGQMAEVGVASRGEEVIESCLVS